MSENERNSGANPKNRGLGRGLDALFDDEESGALGFPSADSVDAEVSALDKGPQRLGVDQLEPGLGQPRRVFKDDALAELAESIKEHGVLQPLLVRKKAGDSGLYEIIAGERRWRAAQKARLHEVPVVILELDDARASEVALIENLQREDLNPVEEALGFSQLMEAYEYTQEKLAKSLGKSRSYIANMTRLLQLPGAVLEHLSAGDLSIGHARALIVAVNPEGLAQEVIAGGLNVRETELLVSSVGGGSGKGGGAQKSRNKPAAGEGRSLPKDPDVLAVEKEISDQLGMRVSIDTPDGKSGIVSISFSSLDQMELLMQRLSSSDRLVSPRLQE